MVYLVAFLSQLLDDLAQQSNLNSSTGSLGCKSVQLSEEIVHLDSLDHFLVDLIIEYPLVELDQDKGVLYLLEQTGVSHFDVIKKSLD